MVKLSSIVLTGVVVFCALGLVCCSSSTKVEQPNAASTAEISPALRGYQQTITSSAKSLTLKPGQRVTVPVTVTNAGLDPWTNSGKNGVNLSYSWFRGDEHLSIEGERTALPQTLSPGQSATLNATVVAPDTPGEYTIGLSMVQEGVVWFGDTPSGSWYRIPVRVK